MRRLATFSLSIAIVALLGVAFVGCDSSPSSVNDFEIQPDLEVPSALTLILSGEGSTAEFAVNYQGLDSHPQAEASGALTVEKVNETGSGNNGGQQWAVSYTESASGVVEETVTIRGTNGNREIAKSFTVTVSPVSISSSFTSTFATVADFEDEQRSYTASGGTSIETTTSVVSDNSNGENALMVNASGSGAVTFERRASAPNSDRFTFLVRPSSDTDFTLTLTFTEETGDGTASHQIDIPISAGTQWLKYGIAFSQISDSFDPVASRAGGSGSLVSVEMAADQDVTYYVDELAFGTENATQVEIEDFERTTSAYGSFSDISFANVDQVADQADGPTARSLSYTTGGNFFGYNYARLRINATADDVLSLWVGNVSRAFNLYVFVETVDNNGRAGGYSYDNGIEVPIEAGSGWRQVEVPLGDLGDDASALSNPGIVNVGFEVRRASDDTTTEPIDFLLDGIKLQAGN